MGKNLLLQVAVKESTLSAAGLFGKSLRRFRLIKCSDFNDYIYMNILKPINYIGHIKIVSDCSFSHKDFRKLGSWGLRCECWGGREAETVMQGSNQHLH